jgi:glycosyltransferase involved in cell wall biosynthesis
VNKEVYIISTGDIIAGRIAGAQRVMKIAKSLAEAGVQVFLCSLPYIHESKINSCEVASGIHILRSRPQKDDNRTRIAVFVKAIAEFILSRESKPVVYLYPTTFVYKDFIYLIYFKFIKKIGFFCEINELRTAIALTKASSGNLLTKVWNIAKSLKDYLKYKANELQIPLYDGIVVISTALEKRFSGVARRIIRIPILCDADGIDDRAIPRLNPDTPFKICFAGYIKYEKEGFNILYESLYLVKQNQSVELYLYGKLEETDRILLERMATEYDLRSNVFYMGNIDPSELPDEFRKYNLLILPRTLNKRTKFGFSTKLSEYLVSGIPILITDVSDNALYIKDGFNGYIVPPGSAQAMADKIQKIIREYNWQSPEVVKNAYNTVREYFDYRLYSKAYSDFFWPQGQGQ